MAPGGGGKRKRPDRTFSQEGRDDVSRASPHRPQNLNLGQQNFQPGQQPPAYSREQHDRGGARRRASRGGRGGGPQRSPMNSPNAIPLQSRSSTSAPQPMSPSMLPPQLPKISKTDVSQQPSPATTQISKPKSDLTPYDYNMINDEKISTWKESGKDLITDIGIEARAGEDALTLGNLFQELVRSGLDGRLDAAEAGNTIKMILDTEGDTEAKIDISSGDTPFDLSSLFLDCLSVFAEASNPAPALRILVLATDISPLKMRHELESTLLESLGLIRSTFVRMGIRQQTNLLYRQSNYNLLREETEGYSKLLTELFTTSNNEPPTGEVVEETFERVKGMIGAFDLDVGRVLDITLDVFAAVLVKQYRFFVRYLRVSSWWPQDSAAKGRIHGSALGPLPRWAMPGSSGRPMTEEDKEAMAALKHHTDEVFWARCRQIGLAAFFEIGGRKTDQSELNAATEGNPTGSPQADEDSRWTEITQTLPPSGNKVAAQVLGFKLRFYSSSARDPTDVLPVNLIYLAALLIKIGFISLRDLYPHIWPADPAMENVREEKMTEKAERERLNRPGGGAMNALLAAGALPDDTIDGKSREATRLRDADVARRNAAKIELTTGTSTPIAQTEDKAEDLPEPSEQKVQLLKSLLCIGALPEALFMLGRFPWIPDAFPELPEHIHRILHHALGQVYEPLRPLNGQAALRAQEKIPEQDHGIGLRSDLKLKLTDAPPRRTMRWAQLDKEDTNEAIDYKFYWDDWADSIPVCQTVDDVFTLCSTLLNISGVKIGQDTALLLKLARIGKHSLATDTSESNKNRWIDLSKRLLVPALSMTRCNPGVVNEVWELIEKFSTRTRYNIYAEWYQGQTSRLPDIKLAFDQAKAETKDVLKRISKTTIKPMARALAKVAYASPGIVFQVAIAQLESYENIVDAVVECARYFTYLAYDVLIWSLMSALGGTGRNRVQADGMLTSKWLAALSLFAGKVFKRYSFMNPTPIVQYVADQLRQGNSTDLIVLEEITKSMAGIISDTNFNEAQIIAMGCGDLLQAQTMLQLLDRRHESKTTAKRLMKSLTESRLAGQVLILLAQERQTGVFKIEEQNAHPKLLGNLFDQLHRILVQYTELLRSNLSVKEFSTYVPGVVQLVVDFRVDPSVAFWISRPSLVAAMAEYDSKHGKRSSEVKKSPVKGLVNGPINPDSKPLDADAKADDPETPSVDDPEVASALSEPSLSVENGEIEMKDGGDDDSMDSVQPNTKAETIQQPWHPVLRDIIDTIGPALPEKTWEQLGRAFYVTFWQMSLRDLQVSLDSYRDEAARLRKKVQAISVDRSDISTAGTLKKNREKKALEELQDRLQAESGDCVGAYMRSKTRFTKEKAHWFSDKRGKSDILNVTLIEHCFFPRMVMSPIDAMYAFKMMKTLHGLGTPNFRTMGFLDQFFREKRLTSMIFLCSAKEAECLGRFLNEVLKDLGRWHADKQLFEKEAYGLKKENPGYAKKIAPDNTITAFYDFEEFRTVVLKWHRFLTSALKTCIANGEYMHVRNAINVLNGIHQHFPVVNWMGASLMNTVVDLSKTETREDLKVAATSLIGGLKRREKDWVLPQAFALASTKIAGTNVTGVRSSSAKPSTPKPENDSVKALNPEAADFLPSPRPTVDGASRGASNVPDKVEAEDGEIEDAKVPNGSIFNTTVAKASISIDHISNQTTELVNEPLKTTSVEVRKPSPAPQNSYTPQQAYASEGESQEPKSAPGIPPNQLPIPVRPEVHRNVSSTNGRIPHNLPSKPDVMQPRPGDHRIPPRPADRNPAEQSRDSRFVERNGNRDSLRDRGPDRSASGPQLYGQERSSDRPQAMDKDRMDTRQNSDKIQTNRSTFDERHGGSSQSRDGRFPSRDDRLEWAANERSFQELQANRREAEAPAIQGRDSTMLPPRSSIAHHPDRAFLIQGGQGHDRSYPNNNATERHTEPTRSDHGHPERTSRGPSPVRGEDRRDSRYENRQEDRRPIDGRRPNDETVRQYPVRFEESHAPTGPRTARPAAGGQMYSDRPRESMKPSTLAPPFDPSHGRLTNETNYHRHGESQYGRLNPDNEIPSGPRLPNGNQPPTRTARNMSAPQPQINTQLAASSSQNHVNASPIQERHIPSGPSRDSPRKQATFPQQAATNSAPQTPVAQSPETAGIHPDRLRALQGSGVIATDNTPQAQSRGVRQPPPVPMPAPGPPRGPNNQLASPIGSSGTRGGPPTGPASSADRNGRDKRFAGLQNMLQQTNQATAPERSGQGASIRGRGGRANNVNAPSPVTSAPPTPGLLRNDAPSREDLFATRTNGSAPQQLADDQYERGGRRGGPREGERRSGRYRSHSPPNDVGHRGRERPRGMDAPPERDYRGNQGPPEPDTRGNGGNGGNERDMREGRPPRDTRRSGRDDGQYHDRDPRDGPERRDERDRRDGGGRKRGRGGDEMQQQGERIYSDPKRARR